MGLNMETAQPPEYLGTAGPGGEAFKGQSKPVLTVSEVQVVGFSPSNHSLPGAKGNGIEIS